METKSGIWIDSSKAYVIDINSKKSKIEEINSPIINKHNINQQNKNTGKFGNTYHLHEKSLAKKKKHQTKTYLKDVVSKVKDADELVIFGPARMKQELKKAIDSDNNSSIEVKDVVSADSMTQNQMVAWVKNYFDETDTA